MTSSSKQPRYAFILVTIRGWPDKSNDEDTRLIFSASDHKKAAKIVVNFGGLFYVDAKPVDEVPTRSVAEQLRAAAILASL